MGIVVASALALGLAGCGTNDNNRGFDTVNNNRDVRTFPVRNNNNDRFDLLNDRNRRDNNDMNISALQTSINSKQYPETKAQLIQDAKYGEIQMGGNQSNQIQGKFSVEGNGQAPTQGQGQFRIDPNGQAPTQDQGQFGINPNGQAPTQDQGQFPLDQNGQGPIQERGQSPQTQNDQAPTQELGKNDQVPSQNQQEQPQEPAQPKQQQEAKNTGNTSKYAQQVIDLTNKERSKQGIPALKADTKLNNVAQKKSLDMEKNHYFSHTSPTYGSPFDMMRDFGVNYNSAGENIAQGQQTPQEVVNAWMNSPGHRKNILNKDFTHIGVGFEQEGNHWSQMFIGK